MAQSIANMYTWDCSTVPINLHLYLIAAAKFGFNGLLWGVQRLRKEGCFGSNSNKKSYQAQVNGTFIDYPL